MRASTRSTSASVSTASTAAVGLNPVITVTTAAEGVASESLTADEASVLQCSSCRMITSKGVYVCPILIEVRRMPHLLGRRRDLHDVMDERRR